MRRQRKEIIKKMYELDEQRAVDRELGCGYTASDFGYPDPFDAAMDALREELAATYGMTAAEYEALESPLPSDAGSNDLGGKPVQ